jgi:hypothetical protein
MSVNAYKKFYLEQAGAGIPNVFVGRGIPQVFMGRGNYQKGHGLGSFFSGLFRKVMPFLASTGKKVGSELLKTTGSVLRDYATTTRPLKETMRDKLKESGVRLVNYGVDKMIGEGYKRSRKRKSTQSRRKPPKRLKVSLSRKIKNKLIERDILG